MGECYHDQQDFESDLNIEVARECDILEAGRELKDIRCDKNPGHEGFIPFKDLTLEHLPFEDRNTEILDGIKQKGVRVVRVVVDKFDNGRWIQDVGSGFVDKLNNEYIINTNNHLVETDDEVKNCTVEFHYDDDSRSSVLTSRGVKLDSTCPYRDVSHFTFHPVPDFLYQLDFMHAMQPCIVIMYKNNEITTDKPIHRSPTSQINFLSSLDLNSSLIDLMIMSWPDGSISYLKSSYFIFKIISPINTKDIFSTMVFCCNMINYSIEIHIDEDDGNSRVIPGNVETVSGESVINISESIFQDEVKKCRLVLNGEVVGRGTRLYFQHVKASDIHCGVDMEMGRENHWIFEFHPIPRLIEAQHYLKHSENVFCIGHPHGGIKMVTFGQFLGDSLERFDNRGRHITQPNPDCQCKEVCCVNYSCKTCPGSSGSPVCEVRRGMYWRGHLCHFMGKSVKPFKSNNGALIENINMAWIPISPHKT